MTFSFTPRPMPGMSNDPPQNGKLCYGLDLRNVEVEPRIDLKYLLDFYKKYPDKERFFIGSFDRLAGTPVLKEQIRKGLTEDEIRKTWKAGLDQYREMRNDGYNLTAWSFGRFGDGFTGRE